MTSAPNRTETITTKLRPHELRLVDAAAEQRRTTRSEFVRATLLPEARRIVAGDGEGSGEVDS